MLKKLFSRTNQDDTYQVGQIWAYHTREGEEDSTLTIVGVEKHKKLGTIVNIYVDGLKIKNPGDDQRFSEDIQHLPFSKEAIDQSVTNLLGTTQDLPDYQAGYQQWRTAFDQGKAGVFTIPVRAVIDAMEKALQQ